MSAVSRSFNEAELRSGAWADEIYARVEQAFNQSDYPAVEFKLTVAVSSLDNLSTWQWAWEHLFAERPVKHFISCSFEHQQDELILDFASTYVAEPIFMLEELAAWPRVFRDIDGLTQLELRPVKA